MNAGTVAFEEYLRTRFHESEHPYTKRKILAIPLFLQDLFLEISRDQNGFTPHPDNYDRLVSETTQLDEVVFVTLNYDLLLDRRLSILEPLTDMSSYVDPHRRWSLVKLHGSVNWGHRVTVSTRYPIDNPYYSAAFDRGGLGPSDEEIHLRQAWDIGSIRSDGATGENRYTLYYPALALPLGADDELACPPPHVEHLRRRLQATDGLNLLVVGYSGYDREVRNLIRESGNGIRSLLVANGDAEKSMLTVEILANELGFIPLSDMAFAGGFRDLLHDDTLARHLDTIRD
jgi:hypothetical protein